jgi:class 3 adenylate cyclase
MCSNIDSHARQNRTRRTDGGRRQLTMMFCDLVGSTALSTRLHQEDLRDISSASDRPP